MSKSFRKYSMGLTILTTAVVAGAFFAPIVANEIYTKAQENDPRFNGISDYMYKTSNGIPVTLPLSENPIAVILENMTEQEKTLIVDAIQDLDEISENINYTILDNDNYTITQKIIVRSNDSLTQDDAGGLCTITYNNFTGEISYPVYIDLDPDCMNYVSTITGESMYTTVVKHEMMHSLGFKDIYNDADKYKTIMYYTVDTDERALDYTSFDKKCIQQVYDEGKIKTTYPQTATVSMETKEQNMSYTKDINQTPKLPDNNDKYSLKKSIIVTIKKKEDEEYQY